MKVRIILVTLWAALMGVATPVDGQSFGPSITVRYLPDSLQATSLDFGPDQRLYILDLKGDIYIVTISRFEEGPNIRYDAINVEHLSSVRNIQNHDDDGIQHDIVRREATGIIVAGTAEFPVIYTTSSDYRVGEFFNSDTGLDTNSGTISRLTWNGTEWIKVDLVRGLPRSEENHATNGMFLDSTTNTLYVAQGGNTNAGMPYTLFGFTCEYALSGAILTVDLDSLEAMPILTDSITGAAYVHDLPTVDDPTRSNSNGIDDPTDPGYDGLDINDPFGGNDGLNQAKLIENGIVQVHSGGYRNPYDVVMMSNGLLYSWDNGGNATWGGQPADEGYGTATNRLLPTNTGSYLLNRDRLHRIDSAGYYGGHPNPIRCNPDSAGLYTETNTGSLWRTTYDAGDSDISLPYDWPPVDSSLRDPQQGVFIQGGDVDDTSVYWHQESTNGIAEYTSTNFDSAMTGNLIATGWGSRVYRVEFDSIGDVDTVSQLATIAGGLDVICQGDEEAFPGTIWVAVLTSGFQGRIKVLEPTDLTGCSGNYFVNIDEDLDGYTNADEIDNGSNPCLGSVTPPDHDKTLIDGFLVSDLNDPDDDDDGIPDSTDLFVWDPTNGLTQQIPFAMSLFAGDLDSTFYGIGFTGLMSNGSDDYLELWKTEDNSSVEIIAGGAGGALTIIGVDSSDSRGTLNDQTNAFQKGFYTDSLTPPFVVSVRVLGPTFPDSIENFQRVGAYIGNGDQDNYIEISAIANSGTPAFEVVRESEGLVTSDIYSVDTLGDIPTLDLLFAVNPANGMIYPFYSIDSGVVEALGDGFAATGPFLDALQESDAIAIGVKASARGSVSRYDATWKQISVDFDPVSQSIELPGDWVTQNSGYGPLCNAQGTPGSCCTARHESAYVESGDRFILLGGREANSRVELYDPHTDIWTTGAEPPSFPLHHFQAVDYYGLVVVVGALEGDFGSETSQDSIYVYDPLQDEWYVGPDIPASRERGSASASIKDDVLYLLGGNTMGHDDGSVGWADRFNFQTNTWDTLPDSPHRRDHFHSAIVNDKLYATAGRRTGEGGTFGPVERVIDIYDIQGESWDTSAALLPTERAGAATALLGEEIFVIGGETETQLFAYRTTEAFNTQTDTWRTVDSLNQGTHGMQAIVNNNAIYVAAGSPFMGGTNSARTEQLYMYGVTAPILTPTVQSTLATEDTLFYSPTYAFDSATSSLTLRNTIGDQAVILTSCMVANGAHFSIDTAMSFPRFLAPGDSIIMPIKFEPDSMGTFIDSLILSHSGSSTSTTVILYGNGLLTWAGGSRIYVDSSATGVQMGTSWDSALVSLEVALETALEFPEIKEVWIATGTYLPGNSRHSSFVIADSLSVYGGFTGTETLLNQRNVLINQVILSGDIGLSGDSTDNVYHVMTIPSNVDTAYIDGVIIESGTANGLSEADQVGAGVYQQGKAVLSNSVIRYCASILPGSAIYASGNDAVLFLNSIRLADNSDPYLVNVNGSTMRWFGANEMLR